MGRPTEATDPNTTLTKFLYETGLNSLLLQGERRRNQAELLATPRMTTALGQEAVLRIGGRQAVPTVLAPPDPGPRSTGPVSEAPAPDIQHDLGILLTLKPFLLPDGTLHIRVNPVVRTVDLGQAQRRRGHLIAALVTRRMTAEIGLKPGQTFAITGLLNPDVLQRIDSMPKLKSRPLMQRLINGRAAVADSDLVLLVTPRLAPPAGELSCAAQIFRPCSNVETIGEYCEARFTVHHTGISVRVGLRSNHSGRTRLKETVVNFVAVQSTPKQQVSTGFTTPPVNH